MGVAGGGGGATGAGGGGGGGTDLPILLDTGRVLLAVGIVVLAGTGRALADGRGVLRAVVVFLATGALRLAFLVGLGLTAQGGLDPNEKHVKYNVCAY